MRGVVGARTEVRVTEVVSLLAFFTAEQPRLSHRLTPRLAVGVIVRLLDNPAVGIDVHGCVTLEGRHEIVRHTIRSNNRPKGVLTFSIAKNVRLAMTSQKYKTFSNIPVFLTFFCKPSNKDKSGPASISGVRPFRLFSDTNVDRDVNSTMSNIFCNFVRNIVACVNLGAFHTIKRLYLCHLSKIE